MEKVALTLRAGSLAAGLLIASALAGQAAQPPAGLGEDARQEREPTSARPQDRDIADGSECPRLLLDRDAECSVAEFARLGNFAGRALSFGRYDFAPKDGGFGKYQRIGIVEEARLGTLRLVAATKGDPAYSFEKPKVFRVGSSLVIQIPGHESGTGNFNREQLFVLRGGAWREVDVTSWLNDLAWKLPKGRGAWKGIYPDYARMTAFSPVWREGDGNACGTGGRVAIELALKNERLVLRGFRFVKAGECGEAPATRAARR